jgi:hypothetical protein
MDSALETRMNRLLHATNEEGGFPTSLVCTDQGLLVASAGEVEPCEVLAVLAAMFDDVVARARRDIGLEAVDEVTLRDQRRGAYVLRMLHPLVDARLFLVVHVPHSLPWRRSTNRLCSRLNHELQGLSDARV